MSIKDGTCEYKLKKPVSYMHSGMNTDAEIVILNEATIEHGNHYSMMKTIVQKSIYDLAIEREMLAIKGIDLIAMAKRNDPNFKEEEEKEKKIDGKMLHEVDEVLEKDIEGQADMIENAIMQSDRVELDDLVVHFKKMSLMPISQRHPIALLDGVQNFTPNIWKNIKPYDAEGMACLWAAFFVMPSGDRGKKESEPQSEYVSEAKVE